MENEARRLVRHRIEVKVTGEQKDLIARAAAASRKGISEFVRDAAEKAAQETLKDAT